MELMGVTATVVQMTKSTGYLDINIDERNIKLEGNQQIIFDNVIKANCINKGIFDS